MQIDAPQAQIVIPYLIILDQIWNQFKCIQPTFSIKYEPLWAASIAASRKASYKSIVFPTKDHHSTEPVG